MLFPTLNFALFFITVFCLAWVLTPRPATRLWFLIFVSYLFYAMWDWRFCFLLFASSAANWGFGRAIYNCNDARTRRMLVTTAVIGNLTLLGFFKYCNFFISSFNQLFQAAGASHEIPFLDVILPIGISFFTFHGISYVVDIYRKDLTKPATLPQMLLYIAFFPQLVAGPIVRASHFLPQLLSPVDPKDIRATRSFLLILGGLFKKVVIANYISTDLVDDAFFDPSHYNPFDLLMATYGYAVQIYCDFSAYTDIAIGVAALLGYQFPQNFDQPYRAVGLRDFWQRWHISLSSWLRDYLYISLGGNTGGWKRYLNLLLTMLLGGLWHGAAWTFVIWGGMHGLLLVAEHLLSPGKSKQEWSIGARALGVFITFHLVCLTWIFFRSADLEHALNFIGSFANALDLPISATPFTVLLVLFGFSLQFLPRNRLALFEGFVQRLPLYVQGGMVGASIVAINSFGPTGVAPFIYFQF